MRMTIKDIAAAAGVSRGTVDRALHGRGRVNPELCARILSIAQQMNYKPSIAAKQLVIQRRKLRIGFMCPYADQGFWLEVIQAAKAAIDELAEYKVTVFVRHFSLYMPDEQIALIDELAALDISGLVIVPLDDAGVRQKLAGLMAAGVAIVTINTIVCKYSRLFGFSKYICTGQVTTVATSITNVTAMPIPKALFFSLDTPKNGQTPRN